MKFKLVEDIVYESKAQTDKRLMVDLINDNNVITINGCDYVLHHLSGKKADPKDRVTSNMLLIPVKGVVSGDSVHKALHRLAREYKSFESECKKLNAINWLYIGKGNTLTPISAEEVVERLVKG